jgi:hypothetical protein
LSLKTKQQGSALFALIFLKNKIVYLYCQKKKARYLIIKSEIVFFVNFKFNKKNSEIVFVKTKQQKIHQKNKKQ